MRATVSASLRRHRRPLLLLAGLAVLLAAVLVFLPQRPDLAGPEGPAQQASAGQGESSQPAPAKSQATAKAAVPTVTAPALALAEIPAAPPAPDLPPPLELSGPLVDPVIIEPNRTTAPQSAVVPPRPTWQRNAVAVSPAPGQPRIAIVLDDLGPARGATLSAIALPGPLTLAFLPYAEDLPALTAKARAAGHELIVHMPMEPIDLARNKPGPEALLTSLPPEELRRRLNWALDRFEGYVGINNHMGSAFTTDTEGLAVVMQALRERGLLFLDSRTIGRSKAEGLALAFGVPAAGRDVFLDNNAEDAAAIRAQLAEVERLARRNGQAIAIGHPHPATLAVLKDWLPEVQARGFVLVPVSDLVKVPGPARGQLSAKPSERLPGEGSR